MATDREEARRLAMQVDTHNVERKAEETRIEREALAQTSAVADGTPAIVVADARRPEGSSPWHLGVAGIVAARIMETVHVPVAVVVGDHGSVRAPDGYNVREALDASASALVRYGGHAPAGGFTVKPGMLDDFQRLFCAACSVQRAQLPDVAAIPFDGWLEPSDIDMELYRTLRRLEPFGEGNPEPVFGLRGVHFSDAHPVGSEGRHAAFAFSSRTLPRAVWWGHGADTEEIRAHCSSAYDILFTLTASSYNSSEPHPELRIVDIRPS